LQGPATPFPEQADYDEIKRWEKENQEWLKEEEERRELAHASLQLRPLFDALAKAIEPNSEYAKYGPGFLFRLSEATATIVKLTEYGRLYRLRQRRRGGKNRPNAKSPFTRFIVCHLKRNPEASAGEIKAAFVSEARTGPSGLFELSPDKLSILATGRKKGLAFSPRSRKRGKSSQENNSFPLTG
jgi:hypothetical protein